MATKNYECNIANRLVVINTQDTAAVNNLFSRSRRLGIKRTFDCEQKWGCPAFARINNDGRLELGFKGCPAHTEWQQGIIE